MRPEGAFTVFIHLDNKKLTLISQGFTIHFDKNSRNTIKHPFWIEESSEWEA